MSRARDGGERPVLVPVARVLRRAGVQHPYEADLRVGELRVGEAVVPPSRPVRATLVLEATGDSVVVAGRLAAVADCGCRRCLEPFTAEIVTDIREIFEANPVEGETYPLAGETIDLGPLVRDAMLLALPLAPLCRETCPGPAPDQFPTGSSDGAPAGGASEPASEQPTDPDEANQGRDPRWAALDQLRLDR